MIRTSWVAVLAAATLAGCAASPAAVELEPGPLVRPNAHAWSIERQPGDVVTDGLEVLRLSGKKPAVIDDIELVDAVGMELLGAKLAGPGRGMGSLQTINSWPPVDPELDPKVVTPAIGATITPESVDRAGWELLLGLRITHDRYASRRAIRVTYTVDGVRYAQTLPAAMSVCTDPAALDADGQCPYPEGW